MQNLLGLDISDFKKNLIVVLSKVEIDSDGAGDFQPLIDIKDFSINTNIENEVSRFCAYSFSITCLNTNDRYLPFDVGSAYYDWVKQGRRIKLYIGIKSNGTGYYYQSILGRIDRYSLGKRADENICMITGRDFMRTLIDYKLYSPNTYWGATQTFNTVADQAEYSMNAACKGIYIAYLDSIDPYDGSHLSEIYESSEWGYLETTNKFSFLTGKAPTFNGTNNLKVYYFTTQVVENVVGDILIGAGILQARISATTISFSDSDPDTILDSDDNFVTAGFKSGQTITVVTDSETNDGTYTISTVTPGVITLIASDELTTENAATAGTVTITTDINLVSKMEWLANPDYVEATGYSIDRVWFDTGLSSFEAIRLLAEVVQYRFYFDYAGNPVFKPKASLGTEVDIFEVSGIETESIEENIEEIYNNIIVLGEVRETLG